ncbi:hypothetical protein FRX31_011926 [Thalictrum thalictroides]|uniref:Uncharacterized protein n=1 Tax=Thalictrum thalictroides TaxID=46969 RepID=A0A7J6WNI3_THATH|nr:hypothetical protein FRX31_011926 [Thalictrum thalictroides]
MFGCTIQMDPNDVPRERVRTEISKNEEVMGWATQEDVDNLIGLVLQFPRIPLLPITDVYRTANSDVEASVVLLKLIEVKIAIYSLENL